VYFLSNMYWTYFDVELLLALMAFICYLYLVLNVCVVWSVYFESQSKKVGKSQCYDRDFFGDSGF
jgi:uncharacterized membrane protein